MIQSRNYADRLEYTNCSKISVRKDRQKLKKISDDLHQPEKIIQSNNLQILKFYAEKFGRQGKYTAKLGSFDDAKFAKSIGTL